MELKSKKHSFFYNKRYDGPIGQYLKSGYKIVEWTEAELDEYLEEIKGSNDQHSDGVVPDSNENGLDIK
jgi:hypothetical protein